MYLKKVFFFILILFIQLPCFAQNEYTLRGSVISEEDNMPLPSVNISKVGEGIGAVTDFDGNFEIMVKKGDTLSFSYIGKKTVNIGIDAQKTLEVSMEDSNIMDEVVVIGYGTQKKSSLTGSVSKLENENLEELPYSNVSNAIKGKIAGVRIQNTSGDVGESPDITIRGSGSISLSSSPLVVVDGFPFDDGLQFINPSTIESIEVLKDASSTAIYGSRGANGVILITTKNGKPGETKYEFKTYSGFKQAYKQADILDVYEYSDLDRERDQLVENFNAQQERRDPEIVDYGYKDIGKRTIADNTGGATNWQDEALRNPALIKSYQLNISGGNSKTTYYTSGQYIHDEGLLKDNYLERINLQTKLKVKLNKDVDLSLNLRPSYERKRRPAINFQDTYRYETWIPVYHNAYTSELTGEPIGSYSHNPQYRNLNFDFVDSEGNPQNTGNMSNLWGSSNYNPISSQLETKRFEYNYRFFANGYLDWDISDHLSFRTSSGIYFHYRTREEFEGKLGDKKNQNTGVEDNRVRLKYIFENTLNYENEFNGHGINALAGITYENQQYKYTNIEGFGYPVENVTTLNGASIINLEETYTRKYENSLASFLGRVNYDYKGKYLLSLVGRMDGYSKFGPDNKYGFFPSASAGWNVSRENFWKNNVGFINRFKIRTSVGKSGSNNIRLENYPARNLLFEANYSLGNSLQTGLGDTGSFLGNRGIGWETTIEYDTGIELGFFDNKLSLVADYYYKISEDLILRQPVSYTTGFDEYFNNIGKVLNEGLEFTLSTNIENQDFSWQGNANISFNSNKLISFGGSERVISNGERSDQYITRVGDPYIQFYGYKTNGVWQNQEEIDNNPSGSVDRPGGLRRVDINDDGIINANDRTVIGDPFPDYTWGFTNFFKYKNFDLNLTFQGSQGADVVYGLAYYLEIARNQREFVEGQWFNPNFPASKPKERTGVPFLETDYTVQDASYISLREVSLGYNFPKSLVENLGIDNLRIYALGQNLIYLTSDDYTGLNPEALRDLNNPLITGYQRGVTPIQEQFTLGVNLNF
ncbi:TonB-linked outer membrane protein, SusC/RagA family [Salegentibacter echinorum]|uniref:TonB-linked outer membrane protein, SusC/RagA family n=1 Tax=Salegentibacter echinorum TaxID=1073325 RepID=A0A1M5HFL5_SALEC|nr:TonB-dependent receptor [Salegentibacter echinorum]SHG14612.1 TonB-linked outer membrane protein, SusC/RagA family [Salegentibacter echinorum]